jgi:hypothetical protein
VIGERLAAARQGRGAVLFVQGRAGFGKTRLLAEAAAMAGRAGIRAGFGAVQASDQVVPMGGLVAALFDGREPLVDPAARHRLHFLPEQRYWLLEELESLLEEAALASPVLVCIDDVHWADGGSLAALRTLPPRLAHLPIMWLASFREGQARAELRAAIESLEEIGAQTLLLGPLDGDAVGQLTEDLLGAEPDPGLLALAGRAHGNPFLLVELLRGLQEEALVRTDSGHATLVEARLPVRVTDSMRDRLARLSEPARQAALVASVLGRRFSFGHLSAMLNEPPSALLTPVDDLLRADLLTEDDGLLAYRHDLIREAVRDTLPPTALRALQRQADRRHRCSRGRPGHRRHRSPRPGRQVLRGRAAAARPGIGTRGRRKGPSRAWGPGRRYRHARPGARAVSPCRCVLGRGPRSATASRPRCPPAHRRDGPAAERLARADRVRARSRAQCCERADEPAGSRAVVPVPAHRQQPSPARIRQARRHLTCRARPPRRDTRQHGRMKRPLGNART